MLRQNMDPLKRKPRLVRFDGKRDIMWAERPYKGAPFIVAYCTCGWQYKHNRDKVVRHAMLRHRDKKGHEISGG